MYLEVVGLVKSAVHVCRCLVGAWTPIVMCAELTGEVKSIHFAFTACWFPRAEKIMYRPTQLHAHLNEHQ